MIKILVASLLSVGCSVAALASDDEPLWEAGAGFGYLSFEHYPASDQQTRLVLPFPTFQYRGTILRANDREGAKLLLLKSDDWSFQFGGLAFPPLSSATSETRAGLADLPLLVALGPQVQRNFGAELALKLGVYQAIAADFTASRFAGAIWEADLTWRSTLDLRGRERLIPVDATSSSISVNAMGAGQEIHSLYFGVPADLATASRSAYSAEAGFLQSQLSFFQVAKRGSYAFYFGARVSDHSLSRSRASSLHRSDRNVAVLAGITYVMFRSRQPARP